jgi:hypothetical protein
VIKHSDKLPPCIVYEILSLNSGGIHINLRILASFPPEAFMMERDLQIVSAVNER